MAKLAPSDNVIIEGARLIFRNFAGKPGRFNQEGKATFAVLLDEQTAQKLAEDDWNVKWLKPREDEEEENPQPFLPVKINFEFRPPRIVLITSRNRTHLDESNIEMLDWANIVNVDLIIRAYPWDVGGKTGIAAYLQSMYVTIEEDPLEIKYSELD